jgi:hypothetical protein
MKKIIFIIVCLGISLTNCEIEKEIEYPIRYQDKKLFVTGFISPSNRVELAVGQVVPPLAGNYDSLRETRVELFRNNVSMGFLQNESDNYFFQETGNDIVAGDTFHVRVTAIGMEAAISEPQVIPREVTLDSVSYFITIKDKIKVFIYFTDPPDNNYYSLLLKKYHTSDTIYDRYNFIQSNIFDDREFNGTSHRIIREIQKNYDDTIKKIDIILSTTTKEVFHFYNDLWDFEGYNQDMFVQPVIVESNIQNGEGIFGAYNFDSLSIVF